MPISASGLCPKLLYLLDALTQSSRNRVSPHPPEGHNWNARGRTGALQFDLLARSFLLWREFAAEEFRETNKGP